MLIQNALGRITFSKEVITKIVGKTVSMTEGIGAMSNGFIEFLTQKFTGSSIHSGIELREQDREVDIHLRINVHYGIRVEDVCRELQDNVREVVEKCTGLTIGAIHIKVEGFTLS
ncbi:Asp23/Gls24 family envelope stress response protein [Paenibacillus sp. sgz500992]|uniref:Asp23/Gls24 family envelope stress response protein n=1 Tax=Paenibacillus sp. sgz500992 TaxID=3242476 RepID=UPI0036D307B7